MKIIDKLVEDIFVDKYFISLYQKCILLSADYNINVSLSQKIKFSEKEFRDILRYADILSNSTDSNARNKAYQIITFLNQEYSNNNIYKTISKAVYAKLGNYPAINYLVEANNNNASLPVIREIENEAKKIIQKVPDSENLYFTDAQFELFSKLSNTIEFSFSAPTSMGKSFIIKSFIKKVIRNIPPENLVIIVPTRALINQFALDLKSELQELLMRYKYRILTNSYVSELAEIEEHNYIFILTPERLISYLSQESNPPIGFVFVDEAHKLASEKDARSVTVYTAIEKTIKKYGNIKLYFSSPNVSNPEIFLKLFSRDEKNIYKTKESPVSQNLYFIDLQNKTIEVFWDKNITKIENHSFFEGLSSTTDIIKKLGHKKNNLIYCNSKRRTISEAKKFAQTFKNETTSDKIIKAITQIKNYIHPEYYLAYLLKYRIAFHYGKMPQLIRNLVEDLYREEEINNVFCTSTLLEGVNMPTQNIFILDSKNGNNPLSPIDFWNLSGRAGRLAKELYGNIYCIKFNENDWRDKNIFTKNEVTLIPTVLNKLEIEKSLKKIEKVLKKENIKGTIVEKEIIRYIANIISVDTLEINSNYKSPLIDNLIKNNKDIIIKLAKENVKDYTIPSSILNSNQSIDLDIQNKVFETLKLEKNNGKTIKLPSDNINYETCLTVLERMYNLYNWKDAEKKLQKRNSLKYYAFLMNQWINGFGLNQIISQSIDHYNKNDYKIHIGYNNNGPKYELFRKDNIEHINILIEKIIEDIEYLLRFLFEKYFNHYYQVLLSLLGENEAGENWASLMEYGTQNRIAIALQNIGLSRHTSLEIIKKGKDGLIIEKGKLKSVNKEIILSKFKIDSLEYEEIKRIL